MNTKYALQRLLSFQRVDRYVPDMHMLCGNQELLQRASKHRNIQRKVQTHAQCHLGAIGVGSCICLKLKKNHTQDAINLRIAKVTKNTSDLIT